LAARRQAIAIGRQRTSSSRTSQSNVAEQMGNPDPHSLVPLVYDELRRIAAGYIRRERPGQTLQATALVNEAFVRLASERPRSFADRQHFVAIAALSMRQILVQRARARKAAKRGGAPDRVTLDERLVSAEPPGVDVLALDEALTRLATFDPRSE